MQDRSPMRMIALYRLNEEFGDLLSVRAKISDSEREIIEGTFDLLWLDKERLIKYGYKNWQKTVRATHYFLDRAAIQNPDKIGIAFSRIADQIGPTTNRSYSKLLEAREKILSDGQIELYLACYKTMYESLMHLLLTPVIYAFSLVKAIKDKDFTPGADGLVEIRVVEKMEKYSAYPETRLKTGLNKHVRNAYSHEYYNILDGGKVKLWDIKPAKRTIVWGPEIWTVEALRDLCDQLWFTAQAILMATAIYSINNRKISIERGWWTTEIFREPLRTADMKSAAEHISQFAGFEPKDIILINRILMFTLCIPAKGVDQEEEIITGGGKGAEMMFKLPVRYVEISVIGQVLQLLQMLNDYNDNFDSVDITVQDFPDKLIGKASISTTSMQHLKGSSALTVQEARKLFSVDTIGEATMYYREEGPIKRVW